VLRDRRCNLSKVVSKRIATRSGWIFRYPRPMMDFD